MHQTAEELNALAEAQKKAAAAQKEFATALARDAMAAMTRQVKDWVEAMKFGLEVTQSLIPAVARLGTEVPLVDLFRPTLAVTQDMIPRVQALAFSIGVEMPKAVKTLSQSIKSDLLGALERVPGLLVSAFTGGGGLKGGMTAIGSVLGGTFGKGIGAGIKALGKFGGPIGEAIGSLAGPLMEQIFGMFQHLGRDAVKTFAGEQGGFDALHAKILVLGADGERLWIQLTQGVGKNNPQQAKQVIDEITAAWAKHKDAMESAAKATADSWSTAVQKAKDAVSALDDKIKGLQNTIANEAPEEVVPRQDGVDGLRRILSTRRGFCGHGVVGGLGRCQLLLERRDLRAGLRLDDPHDFLWGFIGDRVL